MWPTYILEFSFRWRAVFAARVRRQAEEKSTSYAYDLASLSLSVAPRSLIREYVGVLAGGSVRPTLRWTAKGNEAMNKVDEISTGAAKISFGVHSGSEHDLRNHCVTSFRGVKTSGSNIALCVTRMQKRTAAGERWSGLPSVLCGGLLSTVLLYDAIVNERAAFVRISS